ncbi:putative nuclease PA3, partial [Mycena olivaceomarginata]
TLQGVHAWGVLGHATVAYIAQNYLTADTASWAKGVLNDTSSSYLANIASFADTFRATAAGAWSAPLHFIDAEDNPPTTCNGHNFARDCGTRAAPLHDEALALGRKQHPRAFYGLFRQPALRLGHIMPQERVGGGSLADARSIDTGTFLSQKASWIAGDNTATMRNALVCTVVMPPRRRRAYGDAGSLSYVLQRCDCTIELQIAKGGFRLANWLNMIFTKERVPESELDGHRFLPEPRAPSRAEMARAALGYRCDHEH